MLTVSGPLLVLAGAGTGKTRVITYRMAELIRRGTPPERILSVTFTNKAAREMQQRTAALLGRRGPQRPLVATFHSLCVRILRQEAPALGYPPKFTIYDRGDQESAARSALRDIRVTDKALSPGDLVNRISRWKSQGILPEGASDRIENDQDFLSAMAYRRYQLGLKSRGAVDFDDLLLLTHRLFREFPEVLSRHQSRFDHVQIDEYQDTNGIQFALVEALSGRIDLCASSATTTSRFTAGAGPKFATFSSSSEFFRGRRSSGSRRITARIRPCWNWPTALWCAQSGPTRQTAQSLPTGQRRSAIPRF